MNKLKSIALCGAMALCVTACGTSPEQELKQEYGLLQDQYAALQEEVAELESYRDSLKDMIEQEDKPVYVITFEVSQSHLTLDIGTLIKDAMNTTEFEVMVDKRYYDSVEIGQSINSDFRIGSLLIKGSIGSWDIKVADKKVMRHFFFSSLKDEIGFSS